MSSATLSEIASAKGGMNLQYDKMTIIRKWSFGHSRLPWRANCGEVTLERRWLATQGEDYEEAVRRHGNEFR
jgi:hypothetical protein